MRLPTDTAARYPHELSGGQRQRANLARPLALGPDLLVAVEPTSALDVSVQASVLDLVEELQREWAFACLFISHDLAVVDRLADDVAVLRNGVLQEMGPRDQMLRNPQTEYTQRLVAAVPVPDPESSAAGGRPAPGCSTDYPAVSATVLATEPIPRSALGVTAAVSQPCANPKFPWCGAV